MLYKKYIEQFTVSDELKSTLLNNVLQQASEPQTAQAKRNYTKEVNKATSTQPKKQNTFRLHPKRWAIILVSVFIVIALVPTLYFTVPWGNIRALTMNYITNMMVDMDGVTAFGIRREQTAQNAASSYSAYANDWSDFLSFGNYVAYAEEPAYKNYLYKTSETYEAGSVEYEDGTITRVTFKKNTSKTEDVYDENGNLITSNRELTQDEITGQINKVFVGEKFTYMQFIIPVDKSGFYKCNTTVNTSSDGLASFGGTISNGEHVSVRPNALTYDEYGISDFDRTGYYSSTLTQSFIIDNTTGYIYKIENICIATIISDEYLMAFESFDDGDCYYKVSLNEDGTLSFTDVLPNKTVRTRDAMTDRYGWLYVLTDNLNDVDEQNKVIYFTDDSKYLISSDKRFFTKYTDCEIINGVETPVPNDLTVFNLANWGGSSYHIWGYYKGHRMWIDYNTHVGIDGCISFVNDVGELYWYDETTVVSMKDNKVRYITLDLDACLQNPRLNITLSEFSLVEATDESLSTGSWQYADSYYVMIGNDKMVVNNVYYKITATGNVYYQLVKEDDKLQLVKLSDKTYTANTFVLQPINK